MLEEIGFMDIGLATWPSETASAEAEGTLPLSPCGESLTTLNPNCWEDEGVETEICHV